jgi:hypothetical protein
MVSLGSLVHLGDCILKGVGILTPSVRMQGVTTFYSSPIIQCMLFTSLLWTGVHPCGIQISPIGLLASLLSRMHESLSLSQY